jgi:hypothetical protein
VCDIVTEHDQWRTQSKGSLREEYIGSGLDVHKGFQYMEITQITSTDHKEVSTNWSTLKYQWFS